MSGFLSKIFGKKKDAIVALDVVSLIQDSTEGLIEKTGLDVSCDISKSQGDRGDEIRLDFTGADVELLKERDGQLIEAIQLFLKRVVQHHFPEDKTEIFIDCEGYREESEQALVELADKLKRIALEKGKPAFFRALPPKDRRVIHQHFANDTQVKSRSIGDGLFKRVKIYPIKSGDTSESESAQ